MHEAYHSHLLLKLPLQVESITSAGDQVGGKTKRELSYFLEQLRLGTWVRCKI